MSTQINTRAHAASILLTVYHEGHAFDPQIVRNRHATLSERDQSFIIHLCFGVLRFYPRLEAWLAQLMKQPLKPKDLDIKLLLMIGLYQLFYTDTPQFAAIHSTVDALKILHKSWAKSLVNGVLRQALRSQDTLLALENTVAKTALPQWLATLFEQAWPEHFEEIIDANLQHPPFTLRINLQTTTRNDYRQTIPKMRVENTHFSPAGIILEHPMNVNALPGFDKGYISVQDEAAQLAAYLLDLKPNLRVLDACSAPGGKCAHILETESQCHVIALDNDEERLKRVRDTLNRLALSATCIAADAKTWSSAELFDRILLDVPCSATGIIRRHPDIKFHRQPEDIPLLVQQQRLLLDNMWQLLKPGGILVYATCSILPQENVEQIAHFLHTHPDAREEPILENWGIKQTYGRQILPGSHQMDGFYYARLCKG